MTPIRRRSVPCVSFREALLYIQKIGHILLALGLGVLLATLPGCSQETLTLATTTSTYDSGLLDVILPPFETRNNVKVKVIAVGTGQAIALGEKGDTDVILVHAPTLENKFIAEGYGVNRKDVMYNDFVIVGPEEDPAQINGMTSASLAFTRIAQTQASFVSRGDDSGTHAKEKAIWTQAAISPSSEERWYFSAGQGMGATLTLANEKLAYTLTDRGTYLARREELNLVILVAGDEILLNPYSVITVNPEKHPHIKYDLAIKFVDYLTSVETQQVIADFGKDDLGQPLFFPNSQQWKESNPES